MNYLEALTFLKETDFYFTIDKYETLTIERKEELRASREEARSIVKVFNEQELLLDGTVKQEVTDGL